MTTRAETRCSRRETRDRFRIVSKPCNGWPSCENILRATRFRSCFLDRDGRPRAGSQPHGYVHPRTIPKRCYLPTVWVCGELVVQRPEPVLPVFLPTPCDLRLLRPISKRLSCSSSTAAFSATIISSGWRSLTFPVLIT